ncbi:FHA domain-containing protein [Acidimicrobiales bacterium]|nr:FHA domain-containing protein [Acidimicrobiales bacterium]
MSDQLLDIFRICLLALVYLTFFRVIRAVVVELRAEVPTATVANAHVPVSASVRKVLPNAPSALVDVGAVAAFVVVAPAVSSGTRFVLEAETTIGRAAGCGVVIDDARVSKLHTRVFNFGGVWYVEDLGSTNGTLVDGEPLDAPRPLALGMRVQVGDVVMELV